MIFPGGFVLLARRRQLGVLRSHIATATNRSEETVRRWEKGAHRPSSDVLVILANELSISLAELEDSAAVDADATDVENTGEVEQ